MNFHGSSLIIGARLAEMQTELELSDSQFANLLKKFQRAQPNEYLNLATTEQLQQFHAGLIAGQQSA